MLSPAERADVIIDFSQFAGKTILLYNDAPAPMPGFDPRIDYFTGVGDQTTAGGAYDTVAGYGPNTRTIMQFKVNATTPAAPFDTGKLVAALPAAYAASQPAPNIPEAAYNLAFGTNDTNNYAQIYTGSTIQPPFQWTPKGTQNITGVTVIDGGIGYTAAPTAVFTDNTATIPGTCTSATTLNTTLQTLATVAVPTGCPLFTSVPTVTLTGGGGGYAATLTVQTSATKSIPIINKAIQELFDPVYGRMNATLAVELSIVNATTNVTAMTHEYLNPYFPDALPTVHGALIDCGHRLSVAKNDFV